MAKKLKVGIIGLGMVGSPIRRWFEELRGYKRGRDLFCYDADPKKGYTDDINKADIIFVSVPTPSNADGSCNISIVKKALATIKNASPRSGPLRQVKDEASGAGKIVVIKSTVPPGTVEEFQKKHPRKKLIFNPEFLTEYRAWLDFLKPDKQLLGGTRESRAYTKKVLELLPKANFSRPGAANHTRKSINAAEAELSKYANNVFGYIKVIFGNLLADVSYALTEKLKQEGINTEADYQNIREALSADPRIGPAWLDVEHGNYSGAGGYCFPKDMNAFIAFIEKDLVRYLSRKSKKDKKLIGVLKKGLTVLKTIRDYNRSLLSWQGLTEAQVSKHISEYQLNKIKKIRVRNKKHPPTKHH